VDNLEYLLVAVFCFLYQHAENKCSFEVFWCICVKEVWRDAVRNTFCILATSRTSSVVWEIKHTVGDHLFDRKIDQKLCGKL